MVSILHTSTYSGHDDNVFCLAFSPTHDLLATGSRDTTVHITPIDELSRADSVTCHSERSEESRSLTFRILRFAQNDMGELTGSGHESSSLRPYIFSAHTHPVLSLAWSPDGRYLASGDTTGIVHVWEAATGTIVTTYREHARFVRSIDWSSDGTYIVSGGDYGDSTVQVWEATTGQRIFWHRSQDRIFGVTWEPRGSHIASCSFDGSVQIWNAFTGEMAQDYRQHTGPVYTASWSPDAQHIASAGQDSDIHVWEPFTGQTITRYTGHTDAVKTLAWSTDSHSIVSGGNDLTLQIWQTASGERVNFDNGYTKWIRAVAWSRDGKWIAAASGKMVKLLY
jgi:Tol biopolymer transport system component